MSRGRKDTADKKSRRSADRADITLPHVIGLLKVICMMSGGLLIASLILYAVMPKTIESAVIYVMVIFANLIACVGSLLGIIWLDKRDKKLDKLEDEDFKRRMAPTPANAEPKDS